MRETETKATPGFQSPTWLGGLFKHYWLESGRLRLLHKSSQISPDKIISSPSAEGHMLLALWRAEATWLGTADGVTTSTTWCKAKQGQLSVINPLRRLENFRQAFKPSPGSICLNHHFQVQYLGHRWQTNCSGSCTAVQSEQPAMVCSSAAQSHPLTRAFVYPNHWEWQKQKKL